MNWIVLLASGYFLGGTLVALRFGWHMAFRLDRYDWHYGDVWANFWLSVFLWPLLLTKPSTLIHPSFSSTVLGTDQAENARERDRLWATPPPCGAKIFYQPGASCLDSAAGEFVFRASDVELVLEKRLAESPSLANSDEGAMLNCLRRRDDSLLTPTELPKVWSGVEQVAMALIQSEHTEVTCRFCDERIACEQITRRNLKVVGWVFHQWICPREHSLLTVEIAHIYTG